MGNSGKWGLVLLPPIAYDVMATDENKMELCAKPPNAAPLRGDFWETPSAKSSK